MKSILGLVLAGGESRRFGSDKALAELGGQPLIAHAIGNLSRHVETVVLSGRSYFSMPFIADRPSPGLGPLGGLNAGLHHAAELGYSHVLTMACDTPLISSKTLKTLIARDRACVVAEHPVIGFWPTCLTSSLDDFLDRSSRRSIKAWMQHCDASELVVEGIMNINRPEDLNACRVAAGDPSIEFAPLSASHDPAA